MRTKYLWLSLLFLFLCAVGQQLHAQKTEDDLRSQLLGKELFLRGMWGEDKLSFDAAGQPSRLYARVPFTEAGIDIHKVKLKDGKLHLEGQPMGLEFGPKGLASRVRIESKNYSGHITMDVGGSPAGFDAALDVIFAPDLAALSSLLPAYWQTYASQRFLPQSHDMGESMDIVPPHSNKTFLDVDRATDAGGVPTMSAATHDVQAGPLHVGGTVKPPRLLKSADPEFTEVARALKYSGNVEVYLWVNEDGSPGHFRIVRPTGLGLDENALAAVAKYKFSPATRDGIPVRVDLYVEVNFQIF